MGLITVQEISDQVSAVLNDAGNVRWPNAELRDFANAGQREIASLRPDAVATTAEMVAVKGTAQSIPAKGFKFIRVIRNMGVGGGAPGRVITEANLDEMDQYKPNWHTDTAAAEANQYMHRAINPKVFYLTPPQPASGQGSVEIVYAKTPDKLTNNSQTVELDDIFVNALIEYMLYRAFMKDTEIKNAQRANQHYQAMRQSIGLQAQTSRAASTDKGK